MLSYMLYVYVCVYHDVAGLSSLSVFAINQDERATEEANSVITRYNLQTFCIFHGNHSIFNFKFDFYLNLIL